MREINKVHTKVLVTPTFNEKTCSYAATYKVSGKFTRSFVKLHGFVSLLSMFQTNFLRAGVNLSTCLLGEKSPFLFTTSMMHSLLYLTLHVWINMEIVSWQSMQAAVITETKFVGDYS